MSRIDVAIIAPDGVERARLQSLIWLDLQGTEISAVPPEIGQLQRLQSLNLLGTQINTLIFPILSTTALGFIVAIVACRLLGRLPGYRASDPNRKA